MRARDTKSIPFLTTDCAREGGSKVVICAVAPTAVCVQVYQGARAYSETDRAHARARVLREPRERKRPRLAARALTHTADTKWRSVTLHRPAVSLGTEVDTTDLLSPLQASTCTTHTHTHPYPNTHTAESSWLT